jgi:hypothetical protein
LFEKPLRRIVETFYPGLAGPANKKPGFVADETCIFDVGFTGNTLPFKQGQSTTRPIGGCKCQA